MVDVSAIGGAELSQDVINAATSAIQTKKNGFELDGVSYTLNRGVGKSYTLSCMEEIALASMLNYDAHEAQYTSLIASYDFRKACEMAMHAGEKSFTVNDVTYTLEAEDETTAVVYTADGRIEKRGNVTRIIKN